MFFTHKKEIRKDKPILEYFSYKRIKLKADKESKIDEKCSYWHKQSFYPEYPVSIFLDKEKLRIVFYTKNKKASSQSEEDNSGNEQASYFKQNTIELPFNDAFLFGTRLNQLYDYEYDDDDLYEYKKALFFSDLYPAEKTDETKFALRELFLDFLYEFFYGNTFKKHDQYKDIKSQLLKIPVVSYIYAKAQLYYYKSGNIYGSVLYREVLEKWFLLLSDKNAPKYIETSNNWFEPLKTEINKLANEIFIQKKKEACKKKTCKSLDRLKLAFKKLVNIIRGKKESYIDYLYQKILDWQIANFQINAVFTQTENRNSLFRYLNIGLIVLSLISISLTFIFPNNFIVSISVALLSILLVSAFLIWHLGPISFLKIASFEFFFLSIGIWTTLSFTYKSIVFPYSLSYSQYYFLLFFALLLSIIIIWVRIKHISFGDTLLLMAVSIITSALVGFTSLYINKDDVLSSRNQIGILKKMNKIHIVKTDKEDDFVSKNIYYFTGKEDSIFFKKTNKILLSDSIINKIDLKDSIIYISKNSYYLLNNQNLYLLDKDSVLYEYAEQTKSSILSEQYGIVFLKRYLLFWTIISTALGSFVYIWINGRVKGRLE